MKRFLALFGLLALGVFCAFAGDTDYLDSCRKIIYAAKPVDAIAALDDATLRSLGRYALGIPVAGQQSLNATDTELFSFLSTVEMTRRNYSKDEFSLYLQEEHEKLAPKMRGKGDVTLYVKEDGWLDMFELKLLLAD
jgi:hypothetical protein